MGSVIVGPKSTKTYPVIVAYTMLVVSAAGFIVIVLENYYIICRYPSRALPAYVKCTVQYGVRNIFQILGSGDGDRHRPRPTNIMSTCISYQLQCMV